jgi:hypothetical protein
MKAQLRITTLAACLLAPAAVALSALPATAYAQQVAAPDVQSLDVHSDSDLMPGARLRFRMEGTPGARAVVRVRGVREPIALREVQPGIYVGRYVIARADRIEPGAPMRAILRSGNRTAVADYNVPDDVAAYSDRSYPDRSVLGAAPAGLPIEVLSHPDNGTIEGDVAHVRGRTAPFATVQVRVQAAPPVVGRFGVAQQVFSDTMQADARGYFEFSFRAPYPVPGTKYDVDLVARKADVARETHLTLFQRQG